MNLYLTIQILLGVTMSLIDNIFHFENLFGDSLVKLFNRGQIDKAYKKMFDVAEEISRKETREYMEKLNHETLENNINKTNNSFKFDWLTKIDNYHNERREYHMNEMKKLLIEQIKNKKDVYEKE